MKKINIIILLFIFLYSQNHLAQEILLYADSITYDQKKNIIAKGNAKLLYEDQIVISNLIIYKDSTKKYLLPTEFSLKDKNNNYYYGSSGEFSANLMQSSINDIKILLNDGSRIVGKKGIRNNDIDIISKGTYSPCDSKINLKNFTCPIWQLEGEKVLHDNDKLFLYQKHSKLKILNVPVFYFPYFVVPSPLRKERKSGFLSPKISFNFLNTKVDQNLSLPYYFNISQDKELTFTPIIKYGGGVNSSQRLVFDYNQLISGGNLDLDLSIDTKIENQNNENWTNDASLITDYKQKINQKFKISVQSALQTSQTYIKSSDPNNNLSYNTSLASTLNLNGYGLNKIDDEFLFNISSYQVVKNAEDNKTTPTALPFMTYKSGKNYINFENLYYQNSYQFYNIFRDIQTTDHAQKQKKLSHLLEFEKEFYSLNSKINFKSELHNQYFYTENKDYNNTEYTGGYMRSFPMTGIFVETPIRINKDLFITPKIAAIVNSAQTNTNKISNEEATNNYFTLTNQGNLNRYSGTDKLDNSKRLSYGFNISKNNIKLNFIQNYEFQKNSQYHKEMGNKDYLSDALFNVEYNNQTNTSTLYKIRYKPKLQEISKQEFIFNNSNKYSDVTLKYLDEKKETNNILEDDSEILSLDFKSKEFKKYSKITFNTSKNLVTNQVNYYDLGYEYFDECFGINIDYERTFLEDRELKPQDTLTILFSFKNLGSYGSSNLAVSEFDKQDIKWKSGSINNDKFK